MSTQNSSFQSLKIVVIAFSCALLIGCGDIAKESPSQEASRFIQQSMELEYGMGRNQVHSMVGLPDVSSEYLKFEIFQNFGEVTEYYGINADTISLYGRSTEAYIPVLFVTYNDDWTVKSFEWDQYRESSRGARKFAHIERDGYTLIRTQPQFTGLMLLAPTEISERVIEANLNGYCILHLIVPEQPVKEEPKQFVPSNASLFLNEKLLVNPYLFPQYGAAYWGRAWESNVREKYANEEFIAFQLSEGIYEIELRGDIKGPVKGSAKENFTCVSGETIFADIRVEFIDEGYWSWKYRYRIEGEIYISNQWPKDMKIRRQVLIHHDEWYGLDYQK